MGNSMNKLIYNKSGSSLFGGVASVNEFHLDIIPEINGSGVNRKNLFNNVFWVSPVRITHRFIHFPVV